MAEEELVAVEPARVRAQGLGVGAALALALARALVAQAWVLGRGQARVKGVLVPVALKDRTALGLVMEPAIAGLGRQMAQASAQATVPVRAGLDRAAAETKPDPSNLLNDSPPPAISLELGEWWGEGACLTNRPSRSPWL